MEGYSVPPFSDGETETQEELNNLSSILLQASHRAWDGIVHRSRFTALCACVLEF